MPIFYSNINNSTVIDKDGVVVGHTPISSLEKTFVSENRQQRLMDNKPRIV